MVPCKTCSKSFYAKPSWLARGIGTYCSRPCSDEGRKNGRMVACFRCGKVTYKPPKALKSARKFFCSKACSVAWHNEEFKEQKHGNWKHGTFAYKRILERAGVHPQCVLCAIEDQDIILVHHIDKDRKNNKVQNLAWLCHNCHHLVHCYPESEREFLVLIHRHHAPANL